MRPVLLPAVTIGLSLLATAAGNAASLKADYRITLAGLTIGMADYAGTFGPERYDVKVTGQLTGFAGLMSGGIKAGASSFGTLSGNRVVPAGFSASGRSTSGSRTVRMGVANGNVTTVSIEPPYEERPDRVPVTEANTRGIIDPLSGLIAVAASAAKPDEPATCNRTIPVFDGAQRFNIVLSYADTKPMDRAGFRGPVLVCNIRYVPISGHRTERPSTKFMEENRDMSVWLAPIPGTRVLVPIRISVATMIGTTVIEAERWKVE